MPEPQTHKRGESLSATAPLRIGEVARALGITIDTLRYYEQIGLMPCAPKRGGARYYSDGDLSRLRFIRRAQALGFSLEEIKLLLELRQKPAKARPEVRALAWTKLESIKHAITEMGLLKKELQLLLALCEQADCGCPIIEGIDRSPAARARAPKGKPSR